MKHYLEYTDVAIPEFRGFPKVHRLSRGCIITEKIDGTNAQIFIDEDGNVFAGSRTRWLTPGINDNFGFAAWVEGNKVELRKLGPGRHFGEWFGQGIQRNYGLTERRLALFNVSRWHNGEPFAYKLEGAERCPECCTTVPILYHGEFNTNIVVSSMDMLKFDGSHIAPGFNNPEGVVVLHTASNTLFKKTFDNDDAGKKEGS